MPPHWTGRQGENRIHACTRQVCIHACLRVSVSASDYGQAGWCFSRFVEASFFSKVPHARGLCGEWRDTGTVGMSVQLINWPATAACSAAAASMQLLVFCVFYSLVLASWIGVA